MAATVDAAVIGAGPAGLFAAFQLGLFGIGSCIFDANQRPGGQCAELYADKPIYDIPGTRRVLAADLIAGLLDQLEPMAPEFRLGCTVRNVQASGEGFFLTTHDGRCEARVVVVASGGAFQSLWSNPPMVADVAVQAPPGWAINRDDGLAVVDTSRFETSLPGMFAIGDAAWYPGKLRLILSGFHEAALMAQAVRRLLLPGERPILHYTTTSTTLKARLGAGD